MVELQRTLSFDEHILPLLLEEREKYSGRSTEEGYDAGTLKKRLQVRIVGQERDNAIIVSWNDASPGGAEGYKVTYFGLFEPSQHQLRLLFIHDKKVAVAGASVNQERTLLAFTVTECYFGLVDDPSSPNIPVIYKSFLAEIRPQKRIYSLAIERHTFQRVQFLYGEYLGYGSASKKESHMLFLHHNEAIGLYHIPMARSGDKGMFINGQPRIKQVVDEFLWAQWDSQHQRLYLVYPEFKRVESELDEEEDVKPELIFAAYQFNERNSHVRVLKFPLPFPDVDLFSKTSHPEYLEIALAQTVSENHLNMQVVSLPGKGAFYICLQHPINVHSSESQSSSGGLAEQTSQLEYSVYVLHHGCLMNCVLPTMRPSKDVQNYRLFFTSLNDYLMVFLPGHFLHLLNCSPERQPCHHIILQGDAVPKFSSPDASSNQPQLLSYLNKEISTSLQSGPYIYDNSSGIAYKYSFDKVALADLFAKTHMPSTRLAILHLAVIHLRDSALIKKIFEHLSHDPASPECLDLLREYLVGSTYGTFRRELEKEVITLIPFTCFDTYRGHLEKDANRKRIAQMSCSFVKDNVIEFQNVKGKMKQGDFWTALLHNTKKLPPRFKLQTPVADFYDEEYESDEEAKMAPDASLVKSLYRRLSGSKRFAHFGSAESLTSRGSGKSRDSSDSTEEKRSVYEIKKQNMAITPTSLPVDVHTPWWSKRNSMVRWINTVDHLASHLQNHLPRETKVKIQNIAIEYVKCQTRQSEQLLRFFNQALGFTDDPFTLPLSLRGTMREVVFFQLVERFCTAVTELRFPLPTGFGTSMTCLGFRCLDGRMFLQYVDNGVLHLKKGFISRLIEEFDGEREEQDLVFQIICRLKQVSAKDALLHWEHPFKARYLSRMLVEDLLITDSPGGARENLDYSHGGARDNTPDGRSAGFSESSPDTDADVFRPLATLMTALRKSAARGDNKDPVVSQEDLDYLETRALLETQRETVGSLGTIPF